MRAHLAICKHGFLGLITSEGKVATPYSGDYLDTAYQGIHMSELGGKLGNYWQSKNPRILCRISDPQAAGIIARFNTDPRWGKYPGDFDRIRGHTGREDYMMVESEDGDRYEWKLGEGWSQVAGCTAA